VDNTIVGYSGKIFTFWISVEVMKEKAKVFICIVIFIFVTYHPVLAADKRCIDVLVSENLRPYIETVEGLKKSVNMEIHLLFYSVEDRAHLKKFLKVSPCKFVLAIGYSASRFVSGVKLPGKARFFSMVLYPFMDNLESRFECGVKLDIPPELIFKSIASVVKNPKIGLLFSE
jgi:hypothetical protein